MKNKELRLNFKQKLIISYVLIFIFFTGGVVWVQQGRERQYKKQLLENRLENSCESIHRYAELYGYGKIHFGSFENFADLLAGGLRCTFIDTNGKVLFDNYRNDAKNWENHAFRPEILKAKKKGSGSDIRRSQSLGSDYYYYAKYYGKYYIRCAIPYDIKTQAFLKADNVFLYFVAALFVSVLAIVWLFADRFGKVAQSLKGILDSYAKRDDHYGDITFPDSELGKIGEQIRNNFRDLEEKTHQLNLEKERLVRHFAFSDEGIAIFSSKKEKIYYNYHFLQYLNAISDTFIDLNSMFALPEFSELNEFILNKGISQKNDEGTHIPVFKQKIYKNGKYFGLKCFLFLDGSFEVTMSDVSLAEQNRVLKHEMTNNIAHELKTPVSSIRGYLELLLAQDNLDAEKRRFFLERSFAQTLRLSELVEDVSLITKTEEASELFERSELCLFNVIEEVKKDLQEKIVEHQTRVNNCIEKKVSIKGNYTLLYSVFRNLIENAVNYGGEGVSIGIEVYAEDEDYYYLSFYDNGIGISDESHLSRLFDRFYRINEGRSRKSGGSGLGLAIVKNAIVYHQGEISAKKRKGGGLEFVFSLKKA